MILRDMHPKWAKFPSKELLEQVSYNHIFCLLDEFTQYYNDKLSLCMILSRLGVDEVLEGTEEQQVPCILIEHGTRDTHASARFYSFNRESGEHVAAVYCHKCGKRLTAFWYLYKYLKDYHGVKLKAYFLKLEKEYGVPFPRDLVLNFDPKIFFTFEDQGRTQAVKKFQDQERLRNSKQEDFESYAERLMLLYRA